jgi:F420 biosynthesis protein FbiB-like protein
LNQIHEFHAFLRSRRSVRRFLPQPVPAQVVGNILETAVWAPSAHNRQPWRFVVIAAGEARRRLADDMGEAFRSDLLADRLPAAQVQEQVQRSRHRILEAPVAILVCLDLTALDRYPDERRQRAEHLMAVQSVAMAGQNVLLAAHAEGLGGVWICAPLFATHVVSQALRLPETWQPQGLVLLGYPAVIPPQRLRKPLDEVAVFLE